MFYRGEDEYLDLTVRFVNDGLAAGEPVAVAVPAERLPRVRAALGDHGAAGVRFIDLTRDGRNPGRIIPRVMRAFADAHPDIPVRIVSEPIWPGRTALEYPACVQHEALVNAAFAGRGGVTVLCPYDAARLSPQVLADAYATHPVVVEDGTRHTSTRFDPERVVASYNLPLAEPRHAAAFAFDDQRLRAARQFAVRIAGTMGVTGTRLEDLAIAVSELTTNSVLHGGGSGVIRVWREPADGPRALRAGGDHVAWEVRDGGELSDPLAGRRVAPAGRPGGRGLLMVHHIADLVRIHTHADGTAIRCYLAIRPPGP